MLRILNCIRRLLMLYGCDEEIVMMLMICVRMYAYIQNVICEYEEQVCLCSVVNLSINLQDFSINR